MPALFAPNKEKKMPQAARTKRPHSPLSYPTISSVSYASNMPTLTEWPQESNIGFTSLFYNIIAIAASCIDILSGIDFQLFGESLGYGWLFTIVSLTLTIPSLAIGIRRLHDIGKSGWWFLIVLLPLVGIFWLLFLLCKKGNAANASTPLTITDKIVLNASIVVVAILVVLTYFKSANHLQMPQLQHSDWTLDGDTAGVDTLGNIGYSKTGKASIAETMRK